MKKRFIIFYVAAFCIVVGLSFAMPASSAILFYEDFEDALDFTNSWDRNGYDGSQGLTTKQIRSGSKSYKFSLTRHDSGDIRESLGLRAGFNNGDWHFTIGNEYWIGFSIFLANGYHSGTERCEWIVHHQYHGDPDRSPTCYPNEPWRNPVFAIQTNSDEWIVGSRRDYRQCTPASGDYTGSHWGNYGAISTGQWIDFVVNIKFSYGANGFLKIWKNGVLETDFTGGTCFNDDKGPYLQNGIYSYCLDQDQTITIYYDELRIGDSNSSYSEVAPGGSVKPLPPTSVRIIDK